jgi:hypothetical protein
MKKTNAYSESIVSLSDKELQEYIDNYQTYQEGAVIAVIYELEKRGLATPDSQKLLTKLEKEYHEENEPVLKTTSKATQPAERIIHKEGDTTLPRLYTRNVVLIFAILFSTFFGSILMAINLNRLKKDKEALYVILFGLAFTYASSYILSLTNLNLLIFQVIISLTGAYLLDILFWKKHIGINTPFARQPIRGLILVLLIIFMIVVYAAMKNPELMDTLINQSHLK